MRRARVAWRDGVARVRRLSRAAVQPARRPLTIAKAEYSRPLSTEPLRPPPLTARPSFSSLEAFVASRRWPPTEDIVLLSRALTFPATLSRYARALGLPAAPARVVIAGARIEAALPAAWWDLQCDDEKLGAFSDLSLGACSAGGGSYYDELLLAGGGKRWGLPLESQPGFYAPGCIHC